MTPKVGDLAPDFTLISNSLENVTLSEYRGKTNVILLFFPLVNTPVCEKELCSMRDGISQYSDLNAEILAISVDSPFAQKLWADKNGFNFKLLSDFNKEVAKSYVALYDIFAPGKFDYRGVAKRSAFVIDKEGVIRYAEILEDAGMEPSYDGIKEALKNLG